MSEILKNINSQLNFVPRAILLTIPLVLSFLYLRDNKGKLKKCVCDLLKKGWLLVFFFYLAFILVSTVFSRKIVNPYRKIWDDFGIWTDTGWNKEAIGNILLLIPYTFIYIQAFNPKKRVLYTIGMSFITSVFVEAAQIILWLGNYQISDIAHNVLGGFIGCLIWYICHYFVILIKKFT